MQQYEGNWADIPCSCNQQNQWSRIAKINLAPWNTKATMKTLSLCLNSNCWLDGINNISQHNTFGKITENENRAVNMHLINQFGNNVQNKTKHSYSEHWLDFI